MSRSRLAPHIQWREVVFITQTFVVVSVQHKLDHVVNVSCELRWFIQVEAASQINPSLSCLTRQPTAWSSTPARDGTRWVVLHGLFGGMQQLVEMS